MGKSWKDYLLRSGLPLENDVKNYLESKGCISGFEFSYLRRDEKEQEKEFSYDVDASYIKDPYFIDFMVECKYRHEGTKWIFTPQQYGGITDITANCFMHPSDHFVPIEFPFSGSFPEQLAPLCSKGVELTASGDNEKSITQAVCQLSYAFAPKIVNAIENQVHNALSGDYIFCHIPVIVTTAKLIRIKDCIDIDKIKSSENIEEISDNHDCLVLANSIGSHLNKYNQGNFNELKDSIGSNTLTGKLNSFTDAIDHLFSVIASHYCPEAIVVIHYSKDNNGFDTLFEYVDRLINPPSDLLKKIQEQKQRIEKSVKDFEDRFKKKKSD